jgi:Tol biopolymer transport system component
VGSGSRLLVGAAVAAALAALFGSATSVPASSVSPSYLVVTAQRSTAEKGRVEIVQDDRVRKTVAVGRGLEDASWAPDRSVLAWVAPFAAGSTGVAPRLMVAREDGSRVRVAARSRDCRRSCGLSFDWFPSGHRLVVSGVGEGGARVLRVDARTGRTLDVTPAGRPGARYVDPHVSPTGALISYVEERGVPGTASCCEMRLVVARPDGRGVRTLFRPDHQLKDFPWASWAPDGSRLAFTTEQASVLDPNLAVIDVAAGTIQRFEPSVGGGGYVVWAPDGRRIAFVSSTGLTTMGADGKEMRQLGMGSPELWTSSGDLVAL